jgi:hypothetical protein
MIIDAHFVRASVVALLQWVKEFNQFDLYSKADCTYDAEEVKGRSWAVFGMAFSSQRTVLSCGFVCLPVLQRITSASLRSISQPNSAGESVAAAAPLASM